MIITIIINNGRKEIIKYKENRANRIGLIKNNTYGTPMKIIEYINGANITVEFQDEYKYVVTNTYSNFNRGSISNPYSKTIYGIGYIGIGKHPTHIDNKNTEVYTVWTNMLARCYYEKERYKYPAYADCEICEEWLNFQVFADWYEENYYSVGEGKMHMDKDILFKDNKMYAPNKCLIVPQRINMIFMNKPNKDNLPCGIKLSPVGRFTSTYNTKSLGTYDTLEEAEIAHDAEKRIHIKNVVQEYGEKLPPKVKDALLNW